jgi:hypothetical protein
MMFLRLLGVQGIAGIAVSLALAILLVVQKGETRHWRKQSGQYEQLYGQERAALVGTVANYRAAAERARTADLAAAQRTAAEQRAINERTIDDYQARLADARARAQRLRVQTAATATDPGGSRAAPVPGLPAAPGRTAQSSGENGLPAEDALTATEQAIQLDELIKWVRAQHAIDPNRGPLPGPQ